MFSYFNTLSLKRSAWCLLMLSCLALECTALYFQHGMGLKPCVMCIYERLALLAILASGLVGMIAPKSLIIRLISLILGLFGAIKGLLLAIKHVDYQMNPSPWNQCTFKPDFPQTLPLDKWFPNLFEASGSCNDITWQMWGFTMPQWLIFAFGVYLVVLVIVALSQFKQVKPARRSLFN